MTFKSDLKKIAKMLNEAGKKPKISVNMTEDKLEDAVRSAVEEMDDKGQKVPEEAILFYNKHFGPDSNEAEDEPEVDDEPEAEVDDEPEADDEPEEETAPENEDEPEVEEKKPPKKISPALKPDNNSRKGGRAAGNAFVNPSASTEILMHVVDNPEITFDEVRSWQEEVGNTIGKSNTRFVFCEAKKVLAYLQLKGKL